MQHQKKHFNIPKSNKEYMQMDLKFPIYLLKKNGVTFSAYKDKEGG